MRRDLGQLRVSEAGPGFEIAKRSLFFSNKILKTPILSIHFAHFRVTPHIFHDTLRTIIAIALLDFARREM